MLKEKSIYKNNTTLRESFRLQSSIARMPTESYTSCARTL